MKLIKILRSKQLQAGKEKDEEGNETDKWNPLVAKAGNSQCLPNINFQFYDQNLQVKFKETWQNPKRKNDKFEFDSPPIEIEKEDFDIAFVATDVEKSLDTHFAVVLCTQLPNKPAPRILKFEFSDGKWSIA